MPCDINYDTIFFAELKERFPDMILRDWTTCSLDQTLAMLAGARFGIGARLHFLYVLKVAKVPFEALVYQEKVKKLILDAT
jgi:polysaccharide pyruvyl transferase WcaK-like protein